MYQFLCKILPIRTANIIIVLWYVMLLILIYLLSTAPDAAFLYRDF